MKIPSWLDYEPDIPQTPLTLGAQLRLYYFWIVNTGVNFVQCVFYPEIYFVPLLVSTYFYYYTWKKMSYVCCRIGAFFKILDFVGAITFAFLPIIMEFDKPESPKYPIIFYFCLFFLANYAFICLLILLNAAAIFKFAHDE